MKILHVIASVSPEWGGPVEGIIRQNEALMESGGFREIVSLDAPDDPWVTACPVKTHGMGLRSNLFRSLRRYIPWLRYGFTPHLVPWLRRNASRYDAVVINGLWNFTTMGAWFGLRRSRTPYVVFTHGMLDPWFKKTYPIKHFFKQFFWWLCDGRVINNASAVMFTTEDERELARGQFKPYAPRERVVGYGTGDVTGDAATQIAAFEHLVPKLGGRHFLLFLSRIHPKKGIDLLIRSFAKIAHTSPGLDLVIAGPDQVGWRAELERLADQLGVADRIHWPGMLTGDAKWGAFRACEAFVLPSHQENFGIVVAEAMACGKPVLITNKINIWREVESCGAGIVVPDTQEGIDELLARFLQLTDADLRAISKAARAGFLKYFEMSTAAKAILRELRALPPRGHPLPIGAQDEVPYIDLGRFEMNPRMRGRSAFIVQLWWIVQDWLVRPSPQFCYGWRRFLCRLFGAKVGEGVIIRPTARVTYPWKVSIGDRSWIGDHAELYSLADITIGSDAVISQQSYLCAGTHDYERLDFPLVAKPIRIEDQAWLAAGCFISPGVTVGRGAVVGARSLVLDDIPPATVCAGHPARVIKQRPVPVV